MNSVMPCGWKTGYRKSDLIVLKKGRRATIYRPTLSLFWKLKVGRLSESDLNDCLAYLKFSRKQGEVVDHAALGEALVEERRLALDRRVGKGLRGGRVLGEPRRSASLPRANPQ